MCLITHKKYCAFFRGLRGNFSTSLPVLLSWLHTLQGQWGPPLVRGGWWWLIFGCEQVETLRRAEAAPVAVQAGGWAGLLQQGQYCGRRGQLLPCASSAWRRRRRDKGSTFFSLRMSFLAASYSGKGPWAHKAGGFQEGWRCLLWVTIFHWPELSPLCQAPAHPPSGIQWAWISLWYSVYKYTRLSKALGFMMELGQHFYLRYLNTLFWIQGTDLEYPDCVKNIASPSKP